ncbi:MAG: MMPL family transporter [Nitrospirota bacterium]
MIKLSLFLTGLFKRKPLIPISIIAFLLLFSLFRLYSTGFGRNLLEYIPEDATRTKTYINALEHIGGEDDCYIVFEGDISQIIKKIEGIADELRKMPEIIDVRYKVNNELKNFYLNMLKTNLPLYISPDSLDEFLERLTPPGIKEAISKTQLRLMMPGGGELGQIDPLGLTDFMMPIPDMEGFLDKTSGYYMLEKGKGLIVIAVPSKDPRDIAFDHKLLQGIDKVITNHIGNSDNITFSITGSHAITYYEATQMKKDMKWNILSSFLLVGAVIIIFMRELRIMIYAFLLVGISILITLGISSLFLGTLTEAAGGFGAILIGLGVDLPIILYVRFIFLRNMEKSIEETSQGIWTGVLTTFVTFIPMILSNFRGIKELGILTSIGIILCAVVLFCLIAGFMQSGSRAITSFNPSPLSHVLFKRGIKGLIILFLFISIAFSLWTVKDIGFSIDLRELGSEKNPARTALGKIIKEDKKAFLIGDAVSPEDAIRKAAIAEKLLRDTGIRDIISINTFVPPLDRQMMAIDNLNHINKENLLRTFTEEARKAGFSGQFINYYAQELRKMLSVRTPITYEDIKNVDFLKDRFLWNNEKGFHYLILLNNIDAEKMPVIEDMITTNRELIKTELIDFLKADALKITIIGVLFVNIILFFSFRRFKDILFVQLPILTGILFTGAILTLTGRNIHLMSALTGIMLFGIGTDYAIHIIHHLRRERDIDKVLSQTGSAVTISALTTICGFGSLYFSSYRGLSDMGLAVAIGTAFNLVLVFLFIPLYRSSIALTAKNMDHEPD